MTNELTADGINDTTTRIGYVTDGVLEPMKAQANEKVIEWAFDSPMFVAQRKLDGWRYRLQRDANGIVKLLSYGTGKEKGVDTGVPVDKTGNVPHLVKWAEENLPYDSLLDGEVITDIYCESHDVTRFMGCDPEKAVARQKEEGWVKFAIIDIPFLHGTDLRRQPWMKRQRLIERLVKEWNNPYLLAVDWVKCGPDGEARSFYQNIVENGGEGVILKNMFSFYEFGGRPKDWQKVKKYKTFDVVVLGYTPPEREYKGKEIESWPYWVDKDNHALPEGQHYEYAQSVKGTEHEITPVTKRYYYGWPGSVVYGQFVEVSDDELQHAIDTEGMHIPTDEDPILFRKTKLTQYKDGKVYMLKELGTFSGMNEDTLHRMAKYPEDFIGNVVEVGSMRQNKKSGALVHPRFIRTREDKKAEDCILGEC